MDNQPDPNFDPNTQPGVQPTEPASPSFEEMAGLSQSQLEPASPAPETVSPNQPETPLLPPTPVSPVKKESYSDQFIRQLNNSPEQNKSSFNFKILLWLVGGGLVLILVLLAAVLLTAPAKDSDRELSAALLYRVNTLEAVSRNYRGRLRNSDLVSQNLTTQQFLSVFKKDLSNHYKNLDSQAKKAAGKSYRSIPISPSKTDETLEKLEKAKIRDVLDREYLFETKRLLQQIISLSDKISKQTKSAKLKKIFDERLPEIKTSLEELNKISLMADLPIDFRRDYYYSAAAFLS